MLALLNAPGRTTGTRRRLTAAVAALAMAGSTLVAVATAPAAQAAQSVPAAEASFVRSINAARRASRVAPLAARSDLTLVARAWARSMASSGTLTHNPRLTSQVRSWRSVGENIGYGGDVAALHRAFMGSAPHRANVLNRGYSQIGVGVAYGRGRLWVVEVFRLPASSSTARKAAPVRKAPAVLGYGSRGPLVQKLQRKLSVRPTGYYGPITLRKVKTFQKRYGLRVTGKLDRPTRARLRI